MWICTRRSGPKGATNSPQRPASRSEPSGPVFVVSANAGTYTADSSRFAIWQTSFAQPAPVVMGPCFRRDDVGEGLRRPRQRAVDHRDCIRNAIHRDEGAEARALLLAEQHLIEHVEPV